jgi:hypothetical protein
MDLRTFEHGVQTFFGNLEQLGQEVIATPSASLLSPWLTAVVVATAALELTRQQLRQLSAFRFVVTPGWGGPSWTWIPGRAVPPSRE